MTTLDATGQVVKLEVPGVLPVDLFYDAQGRLQTTQQGTRVTSRAYDASGWLASITDALMQPPHSVVPDLVGRTLVETRPDGEEIVYGYDANGNRTSLTPPGQPIHVLDFTPVDLLGSYTPPSLPTGPTTTSWSYNLDRQVDLITRPGGGVIDHGYDSAGRLETTAFPGALITRTYHPVTGKLQTISGPTGVTLAYAYDGSLLTDVTWSGAITGSLHRDYDNDFRVIGESVSGSAAATFAYDDDSLLTHAGGLTLSRDPQNGRITGTMLGGVSDALSYSPYGELSGYSATFVGSALLSMAYGRDDLGRIVTKTETLDGVTTTYGYSYDLAGRLTDVTHNAVLVAHYTYHPNGNRLGHATPTTSVTGTYDAQDRLLSYGTVSYGHADSGELETKADSATAETTSYGSDALGNLRTVVLPDGTLIEYLVDGENRRVGKRVGGVLVKGWLYRDALQPVAELDDAGNLVARFVYAAGVNVPEIMVKGGATYRIVTDHLGSPRIVIDSATGLIAQRVDYDEFGNVVLDTNPGFQPFGFAGGIYDADTGLVRFGARDYDAQTGRWAAKDPILFRGGDTNLYGYVVSDPINAIDPPGTGPGMFFRCLLSGGHLLVCLLQERESFNHGPAGDCAWCPGGDCRRCGIDSGSDPIPSPGAGLGGGSFPPGPIGVCPANDNEGKSKCVLIGKTPSTVATKAEACVYKCSDGSQQQRLVFDGRHCPSAIYQ
jgi:RHS repeat-associated protein